MQTYNFTEEGRQINCAANFVRYERETGGALDASVSVRIDGNDYGRWLPGDYIELPNQVKTVDLVPVDGAAGEFRIGSGRFNSSRFLLTGQPTTAIASNVSARASFTNTQKTVTNASSQLLPPNPLRQYLMIQNNDATAVLFVRFGVASTLTTGVRIPPGGFWEWDSCAPTDSVHAIGSTASNANVLTVEGA